MRTGFRITTRHWLTVAFVAAVLAGISGVALWRLASIERGVQVVRDETQRAMVGYERELADLRARVPADAADPPAPPAEGPAADRLSGRVATLEQEIGRGYLIIGVMVIGGFLAVLAGLRFFTYGPVLAEAETLGRVCERSWARSAGR
jgi:hypothetical protein